MEGSRAANEGGGGADALPVEVWAHVMSFIPIRDLFPSCFVVCRTFYAAATAEPMWQCRCALDLGIYDTPQLLSTPTTNTSALISGTSTMPKTAHWRQTYYDNGRLLWRRVGIPEHMRETLIVNGLTLTCNGPRKQQINETILVRSVQRFTTGRSCFGFHIVSYNKRYAPFAVGVIAVENPTEGAGVIFHNTELSAVPTSYFYWRSGNLRNMSPSGTIWAKGARITPGDEIGVMVDMDSHKIGFWHNRAHQFVHKITEPVTQLWPAILIHKNCHDCQVVLLQKQATNLVGPTQEEDPLSS